MRRGALLLESIIALALFVTLALLLLSIVGRTQDGVARVRVEQRGADLCRSAIAMIEAGIETVETLDGPVPAWEEEAEGEGASSSGGFSDALPDETRWALEIETFPSSFDGLTEVTVTATYLAVGAIEPESVYSLTQLVRVYGG